MAIINRKKVPSDLIIELTSNINGGMSFTDKKSKTNAYISFRGIGDTDTCTYEEIKTMLKQKPKLLERAYIVITDVSSIEDDKFTIDDLLNNLSQNLYNIYHGSVNPQFLDRFLTNSKYETFVTKLNNCNKDLIEVILEKAVCMYKLGEFNDATKMNYLQSMFPNIKMFK